MSFYKAGTSVKVISFPNLAAVYKTNPYTYL